MRRPLIVLSFVVLTGAALAADTQITGFVDAAYFYNNANKNGEFNLDQVEIDIIHQASERTLVRADLEWVRYNAANFREDVEQAFMTYTLPSEWAFTLGKFNAPIGFEKLDPPDMFQYSHALVFDLGLPENLVGASVAKPIGTGVNIIGHVSNGWDANGMTGDNVTWGGRLGYASGGLDCGIAAITGKEQATYQSSPFDPQFFVDLKRTVVDIDLAIEFDQWLFGGEFNQGQATVAPVVDDDKFKWTGYLVMTHVDYTDWGGLTLRYDAFDDKDGWALAALDAPAQKIQSITVCPTFVLDDGFGALVEFRWFKSDIDGFRDKDGGATDTNWHLAVEATYVW